MYIFLVLFHYANQSEQISETSVQCIFGSRTDHAVWEMRVSQNGTWFMHIHSNGPYAVSQVNASQQGFGNMAEN
jgi:hypothetical protein